MTALARLQLYLLRQREAFAAHSRLMEKIEESIRSASADALAVQALAERSLVERIAALQRAIEALRALCGGEAAALVELEAELERERLAALERSGRSRSLLRDCLRELGGRIQDLRRRPRSPSSPFTQIGQPALVDIRS